MRLTSRNTGSGRPNRRLQLTAFGARDHCYFDTRCRASAAAEAQHVRPQHQPPTRSVATLPSHSELHFHYSLVARSAMRMIAPGLPVTHLIAFSTALMRIVPPLHWRLIFWYNAA